MSLEVKFCDRKVRYKKHKCANSFFKKGVDVDTRSTKGQTEKDN